MCGCTNRQPNPRIHGVPMNEQEKDALRALVLLWLDDGLVANDLDNWVIVARAVGLEKEAQDTREIRQ